MMMTSNKALKQQYLDAGTRAGVYAIRNRISGRAIVAGSMNAEGALNRHRFELRCGSHRNAQLAQDWRQLGEASFSFEVLDMVQADSDPAFDVAVELASLTALWREELACTGASGYGDPGSERG
jgi:hypothetical protein